MSQLKEILEQFSFPGSINPKAILFTGSDYPLLFFSLLYARLRVNKLPIHILDVSQCTVEQLQAQLSGTFLGTAHIYILKNFGGLGADKLETIKVMCSTYQGPHQLFCFFLDEEVMKDQSISFIPIPSQIDHEDYICLRAFLGCTSRESQFSRFLFARAKTISLENACLMHYYQSTLGKNISMFFSEWLEKVLGMQTSLFTLSQYFFSKNAQAFFALKKRYDTEYAQEFWIGYWSLQLWQANIYIEFARQNKIVEGRKYAGRLPFTFMQKDWKHYQPAELAAAHTFLYEVDFNLKNGGSEFGLHVFYLKFLHGHFKKNIAKTFQ